MRQLSAGAVRAPRPDWPGTMLGEGATQAEVHDEVRGAAGTHFWQNWRGLLLCALLLDYYCVHKLEGMC